MCYASLAWQIIACKGLSGLQMRVWRVHLPEAEFLDLPVLAR